jgi:hypothetical protein
MQKQASVILLLLLFFVFFFFVFSVNLVCLFQIIKVFGGLKSGCI